MSVEAEGFRGGGTRDSGLVVGGGGIGGVGGGGGMRLELVGRGNDKEGRRWPGPLLTSVLSFSSARLWLRVFGGGGGEMMDNSEALTIVFGLMADCTSSIKSSDSVTGAFDFRLGDDGLKLSVVGATFVGIRGLLSIAIGAFRLPVWLYLVVIYSTISLLILCHSLNICR